MSRTRANIMLIVAKPGEKRALQYDPEMCWTVRDLAQQGRFPESWCAGLGISMSTLYKWADTYPEFNEAVTIGWHLLNDYWTRFAADNLKHPDLKTVVLLEILRKRFPETWGLNPRNTQENFENRHGIAPTTGGQPTALQPDQAQRMTDDDITARLAALRRRNEEAEKP